MGEFGGRDKCIQLYSLIRHWQLARQYYKATYPTRFFHIRQRLSSLQEITASMMDDVLLQPACGFREEARALSRGAERLADCARCAEQSMQYARRMIDEGVLRVMVIPRHAFQAHVRAAWEFAETRNVFNGLDDNSPTVGALLPEIEVFQSKRWAFQILQSSLCYGFGRCNHDVISFIRHRSFPEQLPHWLPRLRPRVPPMQEANPSSPAEHVLAPSEPMQALAPTSRDIALRFLANCPRSPTLAHNAISKVALSPIDVRLITVVQCEEERLLEQLLPDYKVRNGNPAFIYEAGWGHNPSDKPLRSHGYNTRAAMAHAIWSWAGHEWSTRVRYHIPPVWGRIFIG